MSFENRTPHEQEQSLFPSKRSSIENLKKASRVKNSSIFAQEQKNKYDPSQPTLLDRPLASGRPLATQLQGNAFSGRSSQVELEQRVSAQFSEPQPSSAPQTMSPPSTSIPHLSPSKNNISPSKSSLSKKTGLHARSFGFDPDNGIWSDEEDSTMERKLPEGRGLHRHAKSVTFDQAPPQVNEYEMTTPDPSSVASGSREGSYDSIGDEEEVSFERGSSMDHDDSFDASLEDTDKTPVVMPEDWRFMSPDIANTELAKHEEDVFDSEYGSPAPSARPGPMEYRPHQTSVNSIDSNGQARPLPPLPPAQQQKLPVSESDKSLFGTVERISSAPRFLPSPPQAPAVSKSEIRRMSGGSLSMDDRLRLMMLQDQQKEKSEAEVQRERRMRRAGSKESSPTREDNNRMEGLYAKSRAEHESVGRNDAETAPRISRESILRRLQSEQDLYSEAGFEDIASANAASRHGLLLDPDVPIPSVEGSTKVTVEEIIEDHITIKEEKLDDTDLYSIPDLYQRQQDAENGNDDDDDTSEYSQPSMAPPVRSSHEEGQDTPRAQSPIREPQKKNLPSQRVSLPDFTDFGQSSSFDLGLDSYLTSSPPLDEEPLPNPSGRDSFRDSALNKPLPDLATLRDSIQRPMTPEDQLEPPHFPGQDDGSAEPGTPDSVIRHPVENSSSPEFEDCEPNEPGPAVPSKDEPHILADPFDHDSKREEASTAVTERPPIPERRHQQEPLDQASPIESDETGAELTVKSANKRVSSLVQLEIPRDQSDEALGFGLEKEFDRVVEAQKVAFELSLARLHHPFHGRFPSSELPAPKDVPSQDVSQSILRDIPNLRPQGARALPGDLRARGHHYPTDGSHFANRSPGRQRGYLMRQNTKVVVANNHVEDESKAVSATTEASQTAEAVAQVPRKISQPTWTAEPWNGKSRRKSIRGVDKSPRKKVTDGPAPPLPGLASNVQDGLGAVQEDEIAEEEAEDFEDGTERGRLFVKVVGLKDLDLPLPKGTIPQLLLSNVVLTRA